MSQFFSTVIGSEVLTIIKALLLLALAFIVAAIAKFLVLKLIDKTKLKDLIGKTNRSGDPQKARNYIGKLVYLLVFLLFVPGIFSILGAGSIATPLFNVLEKIWSYVPNILAAVIILIVGLLIAKLVRELLIPVFRKIKVDRLQEKAGIEVEDAAKLSTTLAYIVYVLIVIPVVILALQTLKISAISDPAVSVLDKIITFIPTLILGILIIAAGIFVAKIAAQIVTRLIAATGVDKKLSEQLDENAKDFVLSKVIGSVVQGLIIVFFVVEGLNILKLDVLSKIGATIIAYLPKALGAVLILAGGMALAALLTRLLKKNGLARLALLSRAIIYVIAGFMVLNQLGIANQIVTTAFVIVLAALAVAAAIAFGLGGREFASRVLNRIEARNDTYPEEKVVEEPAVPEEVAEPAESVDISEPVPEEVAEEVTAAEEVAEEAVEEVVEAYVEPMEDAPEE